MLNLFDPVTNKILDKRFLLNRTDVKDENYDLAKGDYIFPLNIADCLKNKKKEDVRYYLGRAYHVNEILDGELIKISRSIDITENTCTISKKYVRKMTYVN